MKMDIHNLVIKIIGILLLSMVFIYFFPMKIIEATSAENMCKANGFSTYNMDMHCLTKYTISDKPLVCSWGFYKVSCDWKQPEPEIRVIEVGGKNE